MQYGIQYDFNDAGEPPEMFIAENGDGCQIMEIFEEPILVSPDGQYSFDRDHWRPTPLAEKLVDFLNLDAQHGGLDMDYLVALLLSDEPDPGRIDLKEVQKAVALSEGPDPRSIDITEVQQAVSAMQTAKAGEFSAEIAALRDEMIAALKTSENHRALLVKQNRDLRDRLQAARRRAKRR